MGNKETTKVFNTKSDAQNRYSTYGAYSNTAGKYVSVNSGVAYTVDKDDVTTGIDYCNTTVAFAVVWKPELTPDAVVIDYGLDVVIDVITNDSMAGSVVGVRNDQPVVNGKVVDINKGTYTAGNARSTAIKIGNMTVANANIASENAIRFSLNKQNGMQLSEPMEFYYEAEVDYYNSEGTRLLTNMYSSVTVIPATTVYYEDDFVTLSSAIWDADTKTWNSADASVAWSNVTDENGPISATQAQDRPGQNVVGIGSLDADNIYGYDQAYSELSTYSLGSAMKATVDTNQRGIATFDFYGTGFDVVSLTSSDTGMIVVKVYPYENGELSSTAIKSHIVDTYYGYQYNAEEDEWVAVTGDNNLYQVPVIKVADLEYGKYRVVLTAQYTASFDHNKTDASYDFYLDAIRIYDPCGTDNAVANNAYKADGEGWPVYEELRNNVISAADFTTGELDGFVFVDGVGQTAEVSDYTAVGPNNELYLQPGQMIVFSLREYANVANVHLGMKSEDGSAVNYVIADASTIKTMEDLTAAEAATLKTTTDMYYDITGLKDKVIVIYNQSGGILSLTNVKTTFTSDPGDIGNLCYVSYKQIEDVLKAANTEKFNPAVFNVTAPASATTSNVITVTVVTSDDVASITIDGSVVANYTAKSDGTRVWTAQVSTGKNTGTKEIEVVCYNSGATQSVSKKVAVTISQSTTDKVVDTVKNVVNTIVTGLKNLFGWK